ncbi:hypothetical protein B0T24DRAFT_676543 [Lasiosphaeria ovina]|uniref:F-box domain-containing protein n=1 Tax=Lasiosphaeria ovina TaxID=92902 RepID=A0AAE0KF65_9PEZI|nr:hypothetical protein B0T24DRAFT_676543 [Lasiosphaeria ovina]
MQLSLCWLPEEVLLRIIKHLDPVGLQCLRRTSRVFLYHFNNRRFGKFHDRTGPQSTDLAGPTVFFPWARSRRRLPGFTYPRTPGGICLHQLTQKDTVTSEDRYCKLCGMDHPPAYFLRPRQCIGPLGQVRLCAHRDCVVSWETVVKYGKLLAMFDLPEPARATLLEVLCYYLSITLTGSKSIAARLYFRRGAPAEFLVPQSAPGPLPEMRCFDPNRCQCLHFAGEEDVPGGWQLSGRQSNGGARNQACRFPCDNTSKMTAGTHTARTVLGGDSETRIDIDACTAPAQRQSSCLKITYQRSVAVAAQGHACRGVT